MACDADLVIGADGIHSIVKREIGLTARPTSEGILAYRGLVPAQKLSWAAELRGLNMWTGDGRSFICFPVSQGRLINIVAFVPSTRDMEETWFAPGDVKTLASEYEGWDAPLRDLIAALDHTFRWGIYDRPPLPYWSKGCVTLLGDAAHPMVPHFGQGAEQAERMREWMSAAAWIFPYDVEEAAAALLEPDRPPRQLLA